MEALLGAGQSNPACGSVADLQAQLRDLLHNRVTETRADHTSVTFEIRATATFEIPVTDAENEAPEGVSNIDPLLGVARSSAVTAANGNPGQPARRVNAIDALVNQPVDDPALQTTIARQIIMSLRAVDSSNWTVRQVSRSEQGWTFTYICKDSWQAWNRQASKTPAKTVIGEWSEKGGQDPIHLARPAFDCRGSVKIAFSKSTKTIDVKYEHTPIHKTVAQLMELLAPPPVAPVIKTPAKKAKEPKAPKEPRPPKEPKPKTPRPSKKRAGENGITVGEGSQPKRSRKKKDSLAPIAPSGAVLPPEMPGALPVGDPSARQLYNTQGGTPDGPQPGGSGSYPEGLVGAANDAATASINSGVHAHSILNLPPGEAARRREVAIKLLSDNNLDPKTLSAEQFNIFANQSPELQNDSLAMLLEYGAERLRIVHPTKDGSSSAEQSTPTDANNSSPVATGVPQPVNPKKSRKKPETGGAGTGRTQSSEVGERRQWRICDNCRIKKYKSKCDKVKPSCSMCVRDGVACVYPPASKSRQSKAADTVPEAAEQARPAMPVEEPDGLGSPGLNIAPVVQPPHEPAPAQEHYDGHLDQAVNVPVSESTAHQAETPSDVFNQVHGIYQHPSGLSFPQVSATVSTELRQSNIPSAAIEPDYTPNSGSEAPEASLHGYTHPQPPAAHRRPAPAVEQGGRGSSGTPATASRRSLPVGQPANGGNASATTDNQAAWQSMSSTPSQATRTSPRQARAKKSAPVSKAHDGSLQQPASGWGNAGQPVATQPARNSPIQAAVQPARATSRQNNHAPSTATQSSSAVQPNPAQGYGYSQYQNGNTQAEPSSERVSIRHIPSDSITERGLVVFLQPSRDGKRSAMDSLNADSSIREYACVQRYSVGHKGGILQRSFQSSTVAGITRQQHNQQSQQQPSYNGYVNNMSQQQQPQQQASGSHQNWGYGFGATTNSASSGYNSAAAGSVSNSYSAAAGTSHGREHGGHGSHSHPAQQQRSMNLSSHTYSSMDGEQSLYDLLRSNPAG
ncbi:uncharacterized protein B0H64DRAFT_443883 [Chaetomium fimeti]|uniref:Zn(2)-C6 fungal-type domain-containing protein n=1 Tax=Chaetomium fimeti TaxID=1854472 RepID=A0AAE0HED2_9PEZI|nr:hypothetical protein B0H64DRAFT_443883 [Chaetomium fimeti]